nr:hypothetical protein BaRGS_020002 [Batillaria attramentaria]
MVIIVRLLQLMMMMMMMMMTTTMTMVVVVGVTAVRTAASGFGHSMQRRHPLLAYCKVWPGVNDSIPRLALSQLNRKCISEILASMLLVGYALRHWPAMLDSHPPPKAAVRKDCTGAQGDTTKAVRHLTQSKQRMLGSLCVRRNVLRSDVVTMMELVQASRSRLDSQRDANRTLLRYIEQAAGASGDDLAAASKGFWAEMLGVGDFYYELGVQIVEVCLATSHRNGGLISIDELRDRVMASRGRNSQDVSLDDLLRAIRKLRILGNGFTVLTAGSMQLVQSVPGELTMDHTNVLQLAQKSGYVSKSQLIKEFKWEEERTRRALEFLTKEGMAWVDDQGGSERLYWIPSLFPDVKSS